MASSGTDGLVRTTGLHADDDRAREAERDHLRQRVAALEAELAETREELETTREERDAAREELASVRDQLAERERELEETEEWAAFLEADLERQRELVHDLEDRVDALESRGLLGRLRAWL